MNLPILELVTLNTCGCAVVQLVNIFNFVECEWTSTMNERSAVMNPGGLSLDDGISPNQQTNIQTNQQKTNKQIKSKKTNKKNQCKQD